MKLALVIRVLSALWFTIRVTLAVSLSNPGCQETCGNITIPYPFGISAECSANSSFTVICQNSTVPPKPILRSMNLEVLHISLYGAVIVNLPVSPLKCSDEPRTEFVAIPPLEGSPFTISTEYNKLVVSGCGIVAWLRTNETIVSRCIALCDDNICTATIPRRLQKLQYSYQSIQPRNGSFCGYVFPTDGILLDGGYKTDDGGGLLDNLLNPLGTEIGFAPLVLEWEYFGTETNFSNIPANANLDGLVSSSSCQYGNCQIMELVNGACYRFSGELISSYDASKRDYMSSIQYCSCLDRFEGNPYTLEGCKQYRSGPYGPYYRDHDDRFRANIKIVSIVIGTVVGLLILLNASWKFGKAIKEAIKAIKASRKHMFFKRNGGILLEQQLTEIEYGLDKTRLFSSVELAKATDDYNENRILGRGGEGVVYKGMLEDGRIVAVKKSERVKQGGDVEDFINEIVIVSQINHRNVVKLLGCCLESEFPRIVYEFIPNGTLFSHIHHPHEDFPLFWELRVRIAKQVAGALAYLHSAASVPIYHRDIKSTNILLDEKYRAKISDFGTSRSISLDQTHVTTRVVGTFGYLDPEYFQSSQFTEKSDVYSFGVVLVELITGEKAVSAVRVEEGRGLAMHFLHSMEKNQLFDIIDARVLREGTREDILAMAEIAKRCLHLNGKGRPTMKEVARDLDAIQVEKQESDYTQNQMESSGCNSDEDVGSDDFSSVSEIIELSVLDLFLMNL